MSNEFWTKGTNLYRVMNLIKDDFNNKNEKLRQISSLERNLKKTQRRLRVLHKRGIRRSLKNKYIFGGKRLSEWEREFIEKGNLLRANLSEYDKAQGLYRLFRKGQILYIGSAEDIGMELSKFRRFMRKNYQNEINNLDLEVLPLYGENKEETGENLKNIMIELYNPKWNEEVDR